MVVVIWVVQIFIGMALGHQETHLSVAGYLTRFPRRPLGWAARRMMSGDHVKGWLHKSRVF